MVEMGNKLSVLNAYVSFYQQEICRIIGYSCSATSVNSDTQQRGDRIKSLDKIRDFAFRCI